MAVALQAPACSQPLSALISKYFPAKGCSAKLSTSLRKMTVSKLYVKLFTTFHSPNSTRMLLPSSLHNYHTWATSGAVELQLQVPSKQFNFIQQEVHVLSTNMRADHHLAEEVDFALVRLVPKHHAALLHHPFFNYRSNLKIETNKGWCHSQKYGRFGQELCFVTYEVFLKCLSFASLACLPTAFPKKH